ncbi:hypothetical protein ACOMHN_004301 [Nucella lapillus]
MAASAMKVFNKSKCLYGCFSNGSVQQVQDRFLFPAMISVPSQSRDAADSSAPCDSQPRADSSSAGFKALLAFASSELDLQRSQKRKAKESEAESGEKGPVALEDAENDEGPRRLKMGKSSSALSDCCDDWGRPRGSSKRKMKSHRFTSRKPGSVASEGGWAEEGGASSSQAECSSRGPASTQNRTTSSAVPDLEKVSCKKDTHIAKGAEQLAPQSNLSSDVRARERAVMKDENRDRSGESKIKDQKKATGNASKPSAETNNDNTTDRTEDESRSSSVSGGKHSVRSESGNDTKQKARPRSKPKKPVSQHASGSAASRSLRGNASTCAEGREARLEKHQRQSDGPSPGERKPSPARLTADLAQEDQQQVKEGGGKHCGSSKTQGQGKKDQKPSPSRTPSHSPKPGAGGDGRGKEGSRSKGSHHRSPSSSPKPGHHHGTSVGPSSSSPHHSVCKKEVAEGHSSSTKTKGEHREEGRKLPSSQPDVKKEVKKEAPRPSSSSPKPSHRSDKDKKPGHNSRNVSPVTKKESSSAVHASAAPDSRKDSKHGKPSSGSQKTSSTSKEPSRTSSSSPKPEDRKKDGHGKSSSSQKSSSHKEHSRPSSSSSASKHEQRSDKSSKSSSSRNPSPVGKESSHSSSLSPKPDQKKGENVRGVDCKEKSHPPSTSPKPKDRSGEKSKSRTSSPVSSKDAVRSSSTSPSRPKDQHSGSARKSGSQHGSVEPSSSTHKPSSTGRDASPSTQHRKTNPDTASPKPSKTEHQTKKDKNNQSSWKDHETVSGIKTAKESGRGRSDQVSRGRTCKTKKSSPISSSRNVSTDGQKVSGENHSPSPDPPQAEKRPAFEHQVSLEFSQEEQDLKDAASSRGPSSSTEKHQNFRLLLKECEGKNTDGGTSGWKGKNEPGVCTISGGDRRVEELLLQERRASRSCTASPQPAAGVVAPAPGPSSAPSSRAPSPLSSAKDRAHHQGCRPTAAQHPIQAAAQKTDRRGSPGGLSTSAKDVEGKMGTVASSLLSLGEADAACGTKRGTKTGVSGRPVAQTALKEEARDMVRRSLVRESASPTRTVTVALQDIAPSLGGGSVMDLPGKCVAVGGDWAGRAQAPPLPLWRGPRTPPGSPAPSSGGRRNSRCISSSSSSCSSRSSTSSSTSRGRSSSSSSHRSNPPPYPHHPHARKSPRKHRAASARRRSLRSYSASSTTSTTTPTTSTPTSSEEEIECATPKGDDCVSLAKLAPVPPPAISPLFGPLRVPEKRAREEASLPSESSPCSSISSLTNPPSVSPLFGMLQEAERKGREEWAHVESSPASSTPSPGCGDWQKDSHARAARNDHPSARPHEGTLLRPSPSHPAGPNVAGSNGGKSSGKGDGKYPGSIPPPSRAAQSMTHISSRPATTSLPLPDLTKPPPTLYCGLPEYPYPSPISGYPSPPTPTLRPGYLPLGSPPPLPVVTVAPGYISHSPSSSSLAASASTASPGGKFSQLRNHNNNTVGPWGVGGGMGTGAPPLHSPSSSSSFSPGSAEKSGSRASHLYPSPTHSLPPTPPTQQPAPPTYPSAGQSYWVGGGYKYRSPPVAGRLQDNNAASAQPPRGYVGSGVGGHGHAHGWHPYAAGTPLSNGTMRRQ